LYKRLFVDYTKPTPLSMPGRRTAGPVSEDGGAVPAPYVLDVSVVVAVARGDTEIMTFIQRLDGTGQPMVIPVLAITAASLEPEKLE
jgi:hypothetical protein